MVVAKKESTTGDPEKYPPYQALSPQLKRLIVDRLGTSDHDAEVLESGGAVVGIVFPDTGLVGLKFPMLVVAVRGDNPRSMAAGNRLLTTRYRLAWQTRRTELRECELWVPTQYLHRQLMPDMYFDGTVYRQFVRMATSSYEGESRVNEYVPLENYAKLTDVELLFGKDGEWGICSPEFRTNSGQGLQYLRCTVPIKDVQVFEQH